MKIFDASLLTAIILTYTVPLIVARWKRIKHPIFWMMYGMMIISYQPIVISLYVIASIIECGVFGYCPGRL